MGDEIRHRVSTEFTVDDRATGAAAKIEHAFRGLTHRVGELQNKFKEFRQEQRFTAAAMFGVGFGLGAWIEKAKEANEEFTHVKKSLASLFAGNLEWDKGTSEVERYQQGLVLAQKRTKELDQISARFIIPLEAVGDIYRKIALSTGALHLSQKRVNDLTVLATAAAKRYGISGEQAALTVARVLTTRTVRGMDEFSISLRKALGNVHKLNDAKLLEKLEKAMKGSVGIADQMSTGIGASLFRIRNKVEDLFRDLTGPLFAEIAKGFEEWSKKLTEFGESGQPIIEEWGKKLVYWFKKAEEVTAFILKHWKEIAVIWAGFKVGGFLKGGAGGMLGGGASGGAEKGASAGAALGLPGMALGAAIGAGAGYIALTEAQQKIAHQEGLRQLAEYKDLFAKAGSFKAAQDERGQFASTGDAAEEKANKERAAGFIQQVENLGLNDPKKAQERLSEIGQLLAAAGDDVQETLGISSAQAKKIASSLKKMMGDLEDDITPAWLRRGPKGDANENRKFTGHNLNLGPTTIHIEQKFEDADPDRVFVRFKEDLEQHAITPKQGANR